MTEPVDPQDRYLERLRAVWNEDFGTQYRPGLADKLASSDASMEDLARIGAMVRALDAQKTTRLAQQSGAIESASGQKTDLLNAVGAGHEAVKTANYHAHASADKDLPWWQDVQQWVTKNIYGIDLTDPNMHDEAVRSALTSPGSAALGKGLEQVAKFAGFLYRSESPVGLSPIAGAVMALKGENPLQQGTNADVAEKHAAMQAQGYDPHDVWDNIAFNWNQGESTFRDLSAVRDRFGSKDVDLALNVFRNGSEFDDSLYAARVGVENDYAAGKITLEEATQKINRLEDPQFREVYEAVDRSHVSPGRDLGRMVLPKTWQNDWGFTALSGSADSLWTLFMDPTIIGGKAHEAYQLSKWGLDGLTDTRIYHLLGETDAAGVAPAAKYLSNNVRRAGVQSFLDARKAWDEALASGDEDAAAVIKAGANERHRDLMPLWSEVGGIRPAITPAEREAATKQGIRYLDVNGIEHLGIQTAPITDVRGFAEYAVNNFAFQRLANGMAAQARPLLPGKVGVAAERRALRAEKRTRDGIDRAYDEGQTVLNFSAAKLNGIVADEASAKLEEAARLRGEELFDQADAAELSAKKLRYKADATARRLSTFLPQGRELRLNSATDSRVVEQFARIFLPKWEATRYASMWEAASPAGRRTLAKALLVQTLEASGLTISGVGKELTDKYINDLDKLGKRRYGFGDSDKIGETYRGDIRAGLYESQIEDSVSIPSFTELRQAAAKAAVMGYDPNMTKFGLDAASMRQLAMGKGRRIPRLGTTALRYYLFSSPAADRLMNFVKLGWILTPANMIRNAGDEGLLIYGTGHGGDLNRGREIMQRGGIRADLNPDLPRHRVLLSMVPRDLRPKVKTLADAAHALSIGKLRTLGNPVTEEEIAIAKRLEERTLSDEVLEVLGGRLIDNAEDGLGHQFAQDAHAAGVPLERWKFQGYKLDDVDADSGLGLQALINNYGQRFMPNSPANATLSWLLWQQAKKNPEYYKALPEDTRATMSHFFPDGKIPDGPPEGMLTPEEFAQTGEELMHGTSAKFDTFSGDRNVGNTGRGAGDRVYMTDQEKVARGFAWSGSGKAALELPETFFQKASRNAYAGDGVSQETADKLATVYARIEDANPVPKELYAEARQLEAQAMREMVTDQLDKGWRVRVDPLDGGDKKILASQGDLAAITDQDVLTSPEAWEFIPPNRDPRVITAKVYGKTLDLRHRAYVQDKNGSYHLRRGKGPEPRDLNGYAKLEPEIPASLREALEGKTGGWKPWRDNSGSNVYNHEQSRELTDWMRANGYGKVIVDDAAESGMFSYIALPEMIAHNTDVVKAYKKAYKAASKPQVPSGAALTKHIVDDPRYARLQQELELYNIDEAGNKLLPHETEALRAARARMAERYVSDVAAAVTGKNGEIDPELAAMLLRGELPDANDLRRLGSDKLPPHAIKAQYGPLTEGPINGVFDGATVALRKGYDFVVTRPQRALIRTPLFTQFFVKASKQTDLMAKELIEKHGWEPAAANEMAFKNAEKAALNELIKLVDNPKVASQFSAMNRNWWSFFRAQEDWVRRYGRAVKADPVLIQKAHLAIMGAEDAGILDRDGDGNLILTYPGSGAVTEALLHVGAFLGITDPVMIPSVPDLTTRLTFINPSLNNPWGYSSTPLVSIPWKVISTLAPGGELLDQVVDERINGQLGAGRKWWETLLPSPISRVAQIASGDWDNTGSMVGGATATAMVHMALNGSLEKYGDTKDDRARAIADLQQQSRNVLGIRAFMALFAPGAPGMPQIGEDDAVQPDPSYQNAGIQTLKSEFDAMVRRMGVGPAYTLWAELHPEASVFTDARRTESAPSARTPATMSSAQYIVDNKEFFTGKYKAIAPYFLPETPGEFSGIAWRTMTELGVREYRDLDSMFIDLVNANGVNVWYKKKDQSDAAIAQARVTGDSDKVKQLQAAWKETAANLKVRYPTLDDYFDQGAARKRARMDAIERLEELAADPNAPADVLNQLAGVTDMLQVYREYNARVADLGTSRTDATTAEKANLRVAYHDTMKELIHKYPSIEDVYNGVFRSMVEQEN